MNNLLQEIEKWSAKYEFSFQFWGEGNNTVYIEKDGVELYSSGGHENIAEAIMAALNYIYRINRTKISDRVINKKEL